MKKIEYNETFLKIIEELSGIVKQKDNNNCPIKIVKDAEGIHVRVRNMPGTIAFFIDASSENFDFDGEYICFFNYPEFYKYISAFRNPDLYYGIINEGLDSEFEGIKIVKEKRKIAYEVSDPEVLKGVSLKGRKENKTDAKFELSSENLKQIKKIISLFNDDKLKINFVFNKDKVKLFIFSDKNSNTYEDEFELDEEVESDYELLIDREIFKHLIDSNYTVLASKQNQFLEFQFETNSIKCYIDVQSEN